MKIKVTIGDSIGHHAVVVEAAGSYEGMMQRLQDPAVAEKMRKARFAYFSVSCGPFETLPGPAAEWRKPYSQRGEGDRKTA